MLVATRRIRYRCVELPGSRLIASTVSGYIAFVVRRNQASVDIHMNVPEAATAIIAGSEAYAA
ncbi:hypothetical protein IU483_28500 [Streptomyces gardneri]|nr:hypothetical protein [Streptomyces gardneri]